MKSEDYDGLEKRQCIAAAEMENTSGRLLLFGCAYIIMMLQLRRHPICGSCYV